MTRPIRFQVCPGEGHAANPDYGFFIFSPEDEDGNPIYFILSFEEMQEKIKNKVSVPSKRQRDGEILYYYHFAIARDGDGFIDFRNDAYSEFTQFYEAFEKLRDF